MLSATPYPADSLRFFFLMTTQELQHSGRNVRRLRNVHRSKAIASAPPP